MPMLGCCESFIVLLCSFTITVQLGHSWVFWVAASSQESSHSEQSELVRVNLTAPLLYYMTGWFASCKQMWRLLTVFREWVCVCVRMGMAWSSDPSHHPRLLLTLSNVSFRDTTAKSQNSHQTSHSFREDRRSCTHKLTPSWSSPLGLSLYGKLLFLNICQRHADEAGASLRGKKSHQPRNCCLLFCMDFWETYTALKEKWKKENKGTERRNNFRCCSLHSAAGPPASCVCSGTCVEIQRGCVRDTQTSKTRNNTHTNE